MRELKRQARELFVLFQKIDRDLLDFYHSTKNKGNEELRIEEGYYRFKSYYCDLMFLGNVQDTGDLIMMIDAIVRWYGAYLDVSPDSEFTRIRKKHVDSLLALRASFAQ